MKEVVCWERKPTGSCSLATVEESLASILSPSWIWVWTTVWHNSLVSHEYVSCGSNYYVFIISAGIILITKLYSVERVCLVSWVLAGSTSGHLPVISSTACFSFSHRPVSIAAFIVCSQYPVGGSYICKYTIIHKGYVSRVPC